MGAPERAAGGNDQISLDAPIFVGREREITDLSAVLLAGGSFAIRGEIGTGRRALLRQIYYHVTSQNTNQNDVVVWPSCQSTKTMIVEIAQGVHRAIGLNVPARLIAQSHRAKAARTGRVEYRHIHRQFMRETIRSQTEIILATLREHLAWRRGAVILFIERLELPPTSADFLLALSDIGIQIAGCIESTNTRNRIQRLTWRFKTIHDITPLTDREVRSWIEQYLEREALNFDSPRTRERFIVAAIRASNGKPAAVEQMLIAARCEREVTREHLRGMDADAARVYVDMTPLIVVVAAIMLALRYISRGASLEEMLILAGVGTSVFWVILYFVRLMHKR